MNLTVDLQDVIVQKHTEKVQNAQKVIDDCNKILEKAAEDDENILHAVGFRKISTVRDTKRTNERLLEDLSHGIILTKAEVKEICTIYGFRCLKVELYKGPVPAELPQMLKEYAKAHYPNKKVNVVSRTEVSSVQQIGHLYIMAPSQFFELKDKEEPIDPVLLEDLGENQYRLVYKWGKDMSVFRKILNYPVRTIIHKWLVFGIPLYTLVWGIMLRLTANTDRPDKAGILVVGGVVSLLILIFGLAAFPEDNVSKWDSEVA